MPLRIKVGAKAPHIRVGANAPIIKIGVPSQKVRIPQPTKHIKPTKFLFPQINAEKTLPKHVSIQKFYL